MSKSRDLLYLWISREEYLPPWQFHPSCSELPNFLDVTCRLSFTGGLGVFRKTTRRLRGLRARVNTSGSRISQTEFL